MQTKQLRGQPLSSRYKSEELYEFDVQQLTHLIKIINLSLGHLSYLTTQTVKKVA